MVIFTFMVYLLFRLNPAGLTCFKKNNNKSSNNSTAKTSKTNFVTHPKCNLTIVFEVPRGVNKAMSSNPQLCVGG